MIKFLLIGNPGNTIQIKLMAQKDEGTAAPEQCAVPKEKNKEGSGLGCLKKPFCFIFLF